MATFYATKDPNSDLDYAVNWGDWLVGTDTISTSTWTGPTDLTIYGDSHGTATTTTWISGGTSGEVYTVTNRVQTAAGRIDERSIEFTMVDK
jgi:hypothetical protein